MTNTMANFFKPHLTLSFFYYKAPPPPHRGGGGGGGYLERGGKI